MFCVIVLDYCVLVFLFFFFQAEDGIRDIGVTGVQTCALPIYSLILDDFTQIATESCRFVQLVSMINCLPKT